jgi:hypothetical protein
VRPTTKKLNSMFDEPSAKYKKDNAHTKSRQNQKVKSELLVSPCQVIILVPGRRRDSKQPKSSSKAKLCSRDR